MTSVARMSARRPVSPAERLACEEFARLLADSGKSQEALADEVGVSAGAIGHWKRGEIPVPLRRAAATALAVGGSPDAICVEWREAIAPYLGTLGPMSQPARLNPYIIQITANALNVVLGRRRGTALDLVRQEHAELFAEVLAMADAMLREPGREVEFGAAVADLVAEKEVRGSDAGGRKQAGGADRSGHLDAGAGG